MMLSPEMNKALNQQINLEYSSFWLYMSMAAWARVQNYSGFEHWLKVQAEEEKNHAERIYNYVLERDGTVCLEEIPAPECRWDSFECLFDSVLEHEQATTEKITDLMNLAERENDHASCIFLQWFVTEQVEEEASVGSVLKLLKSTRLKPLALFYIDRELASRKPGSNPVL